MKLIEDTDACDAPGTDSDTKAKGPVECIVCAFDSDLIHKPDFDMISVTSVGPVHNWCATT